jgi:hypothetical protein
MRSDDENAERKQIEERAIVDAVATLGSEGVTLTPEQAGNVNVRVRAAVAKLRASEPSETLRAAIGEAVFRIALEEIGLLASAPTTDELMRAVMDTVAELVRAGRYVEPTMRQARQVGRIVRNRVVDRMSKGPTLNPADTLQWLRDTAARAVLDVLGPPPSRLSLN